MKKIAKQLVVIAALVFTVALGKTAYAVEFSDVLPYQWFYGAVNYVVDNGLFRGTTETTFSPDNVMTRGQFVTVLGKLEGVSSSAPYSGKFTDVTASDYFAPYVSWANAQGIVSGTSNTTFSPHASITREQMAVMIAKYLQSKGLRLPADANAASSFTDADSISAYAVVSVNTLRQSGLLAGTAGAVLPQNGMTRAQAAAVFKQLREKIQLSVWDIGPLHVSGSQLLDAKNNPTQLKGISTHGIAWFPDYINNACFKQLHDEMGANVVRLAMYTAEYNGYCEGGDKKWLKQLIDNGVKYASQNHMYVIIDWHILRDETPLKYQDEAIAFFSEMAQKYKDYPNVLYEICNEPNGSTSWSQIKAYAQKVIPVIRQYAPDNIIIVGTPTWSQEVDKAAADPITGYNNIMYTLHFYADTHRDDLRNRMVSAIKKGLPIFVTEYGICDASGSGAINEAQANAWVQVMNQYNVSYAAWNMSNKDETSSIFKSSCKKTSGFTTADFSNSGKWLIRMLTGRSAIAGSTLPDDTGTAQPDTPVTPPTPADVTLSQGNLSIGAKVSNSWSEGGQVVYQYDLSITNTGTSPVSSWSVSIPFNEPPTVKTGWGSKYSVNGNTLTVSNESYNGTIAAGQTLSGIGIQVSGTSELKIVS